MIQHIVQVHPVENGEPNLYKVKTEREFNAKKSALEYIEAYNKMAENFPESNQFKAVYHGRVNDATGELE